MSKEDAELGVASALPPYDGDEKPTQHRPYAGDGVIPEDFREQDFWTRNGLNLRSFTKRKSLPPHSIPAASRP